jgi:hypothetical protein
VNIQRYALTTAKNISKIVSDLGERTEVHSLVSKLLRPIAGLRPVRMISRISTPAIVKCAVFENFSSWIPINPAATIARVTSTEEGTY